MSASESARDPHATTDGPPDASPYAAVADWTRPSVADRAWRRVIFNLRALRLRWRGATIGEGTSLGAGFMALDARGLRIGHRVAFGPRARVEVHRTDRGHGRLEIGDRTVFLNDAHLGAAGLVRIGADCLFAAGCTILDHDHDFSDPFDGPRRNRGLLVAPIEIGDHVFLGERVSVLKGVRIGRGAVVGAHAVVVRDLPPMSMCVGAPARPIATWCPERRQWRRTGA
jgi:acetyltransferase-like isoleucine patch superfamily enzyme